MKKLLIPLLAVLFLTTASAVTIGNNVPKELPQYFRDVKSTTKLNTVIHSAISREILQTGSFFRPDATVPAIMFLDALLRDAGFEPKSREFKEILNEAVEREIISAQVATNLKFDTPMTKFRAIEAIIKTKKLLPARRISAKFRGIYPFVNLGKSKNLPYIEAAVSSGIISEFELKHFQSNELVTRREFLTWIYNYFDHGTRQIKLEADVVFQRNQRAFRYNFGLKSRFSIEKKNTQLRKINKKRKSREKSKSSLNTVKSGEIARLEEIKHPFPGKEILDEIYNEIIERYRFSKNLTEDKKQEMIDRALSGLVNALGDKYSTYIKPKKSAEFLDKLNGDFEGIGAYVEMIDGKFTIIAPIAGSPAEKSGLQAQDIVTEVNDKDIFGLSISEIVELIMGPAGTSVDLEISRDSQKLNFTIIRDKIDEPEVVLKWEKHVPIIEIHRFTPDTINLLNDILVEVLAENIRGIVLDLRNNPGGLLSSATEVSELFLEKNEVIFYIEERNSKKRHLSRKTGILANFPGEIVVLQNKGTASASEILIGMLQDYEKVKTIIGETSVGKGTAQTVRNLKNGGLLKLTVSKWLTPKKRWINEIGIIPDLEISSPTIEERKRKIDKQLDAAIQEVLNY